MQFMINLSSLNVNGLKSKPKRNRVIEWIKSQKCSLCFLQETHFDKDIEMDVRNKTEFELYCSHGNTSSRGVAIFIKRSFDHKVISCFKDEEGRIILLNIEIDDCIFSMLCLYAPNCKSSRNIFFKKVDSMLKEHGIGIPIVAGDFNECFKNLDRKSSRSEKYDVKPVHSIKTLLKSNNMIDIWRFMNENKQQYTWRRKDKSQASRIDMILVGNDFIPFIENCQIKPAIIDWTDHQSVFVKFRTGTTAKGRDRKSVV